VVVIAHDAIGEAYSIESSKILNKPGQEIPFVVVVGEDGAALISSTEEMISGAFVLES
jgi:hypothetical protein